MNCEVALLEREPVHGFRHQQGQHFLAVNVPALLRLVQVGARVLTPIYKQVLFARVPVNVDEQEDLPALERLLDHFLHREDFCRILIGGVLPLPIQVEPHQIAAIVPDDDTIGVQHGNHLEDESITQYFGVLFVADDELEEAFNDKTRT